MPVATKVDAFQGKICRDEHFVRFSGMRWESEHSAVVPDSSLNRWSLPAPRHPPNLRDQLFFANSHGNYYKRAMPIGQDLRLSR
jgi:hypothetical protein